MTRIGADTALRKEGVLDSFPVFKGLNLDDLRSHVEDWQEKLRAWPGGSVSDHRPVHQKVVCSIPGQGGQGTYRGCGFEP